MSANNKPTAHGEGTAILCFVAGVAAVCMGYSIYSHLQTIHDQNMAPKKNPHNKPGSKLEDSIRLKSLAYLTQSNNVNIRSSSVKIILERAMSPTYLPKIIAACNKDQPIEIRTKALPALQLLTRKENNKAVLIAEDALEVLVDALKCTDPSMEEVTQRYAAVAICDLIQGSDINKYRILELGVLESIKRILTSEEIRNNELKYWTLMILYQISLSDPLPKVLTETGFVRLLARMARMTYGNTNMPKFCMQSLVRIAANVDVNEAKKVLTQLLEYNIVDLISNCLRGDDVELIYWAAGLMHEFVLKDVAADQFREIKGIHAIMAGLLSAEEMYISRVILRTIKFMAFGQDKFRREMVRSGMVKKIMRCLSLDDEDVRYWTILCIHVVAGQVESHEDIITASEFEILLELALSTKIKVGIFVSDILSLICCISSNNTFMEPNITLIIKTLNTLLMEGELDVQYNAAGAIFNVMTMTFAFAGKVRDICFDNLISMSTTAVHERVQLTCAKGALMMAIKSRFLAPQVNQQVTEPLIETVNTITKPILPVMMAQALIKASKDKTANYPTSSNKSGSEGMLLITDDSEEELETEKSSIEEDEEGTEGFPHSSEYIDITEQGTISNASRLDRVLKHRERASQKAVHKDKDSGSTKIDVAYLFDTSASKEERESLFAKFELPSTARNQFMGAMTALNILLENEQMMNHLMTRKNESGVSFPSLDMGDNILVDIDDIAPAIYEEEEEEKKDVEKDKMVSPVLLRLTSKRITESADLSLTETLRQLVTNLVHLCMYPALNEWATRHHEKYPLEVIDESKVDEMYSDLIGWVSSYDVLSSRAKKGPSDSVMSDSSSDECDGNISIYLQRYRRSRQKQDDNSDTSSGDDNDDDDDDDEEEEDQHQSVFRRPKKLETAAERLGETRKKGFTNRALILLNSLMRYGDYKHMHIIRKKKDDGHNNSLKLIHVPLSIFFYYIVSVRKYLVEEANFVPVLIYLYQDYHSRHLMDRVMMCLGSLFANDVRLDIPNKMLELLIALLWRSNMKVSKYNQKTSHVFYSRLVLSYCLRHASRRQPTTLCFKANHPSFVEIDLSSRSKYCIVSYENRLQVRNDSWTFESVRATHGVPAVTKSEDGDATHKYAFEVILQTDGLMQLGWATEFFQCDPEGGKGVGDDAHSYGYDGNRSKKWHGRYTSLRTSYGLKWVEGDIITCAIDMDVGEIRYYKNGEDMGVAFYGVLVSRSWYPAISLATGQQCKFQFGGSMDPLKYLPEGYIPVGSLVPPTNTIDIKQIPSSTNQESYHVQENSTIDLSSNKLVSDTANDLHVEKVDSNRYCKSSLPSLYLEVKISGYNTEESPVIFGLQSLAPSVSVYFQYSKDKMIGCLEMTSGKYQSEAFNISLQDGDILGIIYIEKTNEFGLTLNGIIKVFIALKEKIEPGVYIPFVSGSLKYEINYGDEPLEWQLANKGSFKQSVVRYLSNLLRVKKHF
ncbi:MAG: hypothetical protein EXX96DRAFT_562409 [Benjaminiella poitrasii]|nr:MAG: hypothetical protein EXX96DRAFT_562409 [Benjaminiella poitrasii]